MLQTLDLPKKLKIISGNANILRLAADKIKNKYKKKKPLSTLKAKNKKAADWLRRAGYLDTDDLQTIDYNNDTNVADLDDLQTIDYNNDTNVADIDDLETIGYNNDTSVGDFINLKKTSGTQLATKKILIRYTNLARRKPYQRPSASAATTEFDDLERVGYNNDTSISDLNDIVSGTRKNINAQKTAKKILQKYKKIAQNKKNKGKETTEFDDLETVDYNNDTSVSDLVNLKKTRGTQLAAKKIIKKYRNLARKKPYQRPPPRTETTEFDDLETIDYNNDTSINDLNDIVSNTKKGKNTQLAAKKILKKI